MSYILGLIGVLLAALGYNFVKRRSAEALNANIEVGKKLNEVDKSVAKNEGLLQSEEERREAIKRQMDASSKEFKTIKDLEDFLSRDLSKGPDDK